jgi:hypothetical protein
MGLSQYSMARPEFGRIFRQRKIPLHLEFGTVDIRKIYQARPRNGNAGSCDLELIMTEKVLFHGKVGKM